MSTQTPGRYRPGVFVCALLFISLLPHSLRADTPSNCTVQGKSEPVTLKQVIDGDTLRLHDGRTVRLIGVNTPELGRDGAPDQVLADRARRMAAQWLEGDVLLLQSGADNKDRHGRFLGSVFRRSDQGLLSEYLVGQGLGWQVTVPPNTLYSDCLKAAELAARAAGRGIWAPGRYPLLVASELVPADAGFQRVRGRVSSVTSSRHAWWLELDAGLSLRLGHSDLKNFGSVDIPALTGKELTVRGWLIYRGRRQQGYPQYMMHLQHPAMLEAIEE